MSEMQHELQLARELQERMLPDALPRVPGIDLGARIVPAREVSGDFYDLFMVDDETLGVVIGDVCDKGMAAALYMARAGHEHPLLYGADGAPRPLPQTVGQPLGLVPEPAIDVQTRALAPDDTLLLYTDGITDATDATAAFFGGERLDASVRSAFGATAQGLCDHIVQQVAAFQGAARQADDITLVALRAS